MLKRDHEILNHCIQFESDGSIKVLQSPYSLMQRVGHKSSSSDSINSSEEKKISSRPEVVLIGQSNSTGQNVSQPGNTACTEEKKFQSPIKDSPVEFSLSNRIKGKILNTGNICKQNSQTLNTPRPRMISEHDIEQNSDEKPKEVEDAEAEEVKTQLSQKSRQASEVA